MVPMLVIGSGQLRRENDHREPRGKQLTVWGDLRRQPGCGAAWRARECERVGEVVVVLRLEVLGRGLVPCPKESPTAERHAVCRRRWARALGVVNGHTGVEIARLQHSASEIAKLRRKTKCHTTWGAAVLAARCCCGTGRNASRGTTQLASRLAARRRIVSNPLLMRW
jgi:hypothetical protein